jgi:type II secretory pathway component GspD/PulD (secretin)
MLPAVFLVALAPLALQGDEPQRAPGQKDAAGLEKRIAEIDRQIALLQKELQALRTAKSLPAAPADDETRRLLRAQREIEELIHELMEKKKKDLPPAFNVFSLKHAKAGEVAKALQELFPEKDGRTVRIAAVPSLNAVLVRGSQTESEIVEAIISKLEALGEASAKERTGRN